MDIRKLEIFEQVVTLGSFSEAAKSMHMAQPAVSIAIRKLEQSLEVPLFDRSGRRIQLTAEGSQLLQRIRPILQELEALKQSTRAMKNLLQGELSLACPSMLATYFLPDLLSGFLTEHPGLRASVTQAGTQSVMKMLMEDEAEIGVISLDGDKHSEFELIPLATEQLVLCVNEEHSWAGRKRIAITELADAPMVVYESGYFIRSKLDQLCAEKAVAPDYRMQSNFLPLLLNMVKQGLGAGIGLEIMARREPGIIGIPLSPRAQLSMALAKRRGRTISRANQAFLDWAAFTL